MAVLEQSAVCGVDGQKYLRRQCEKLRPPNVGCCNDIHVQHSTCGAKVVIALSPLHTLLVLQHKLVKLSGSC